jgi:RNA 2',3'-cyclic 3'-phosphodiesterase
MASSSRIFVAFTIPDVQRTRLGRLQGLIAPEIPNARWASPEMFHVTLAFLGDVPDVALNAVCRSVAAACEGFPPLTVNLQSLGAFPDPTRPRVAWVGLTGPGLDTLSELQRSIVKAVGEAGYPPEDDRFNPHLTLGRIKSKKGEDLDISPLVAHYRTWSAGNFAVNAVVTFASTLTPEGPAHMALAHATLRREKHKSGA